MTGNMGFFREGLSDSSLREAFCWSLKLMDGKYDFNMRGRLWRHGFLTRSKTEIRRSRSLFVRAHPKQGVNDECIYIRVIKSEGKLFICMALVVDVVVAEVYV